MHQQQNHRAFAALKTGVPANTIVNNDGALNSPSSSSLLSSNSSSSSSSTLRAPVEHSMTAGRLTAVQDRNSATHFINSSRITKKSHSHNIIKSLKPPKAYIIKRNIRTRTLTVPEQSLSECARHVREIISTYTRDWLVVDLFDDENYNDNDSLHRHSEYFSDSSDSSSDNTSSKSLIVYDDNVNTVSKTSSASLHRAASAPSTAGYNSVSQISATKLRNNIKTPTHPTQPPPSPPITNNVSSATKYNNNTSSHTADLPLLDDVLHYDKNYRSKQKSKNSLRQHTRLFSFYKIENSNCGDDFLAHIPVPRDYTGMQHHFCRLLVECIHLECSEAGTTPQDTVSGYATSDSLTSQSSSGTNQSNLSNMPNLFGHMAVYDLRARRKLTENCYLDLQNQTSLTRHRNACVIDIPNCSKGSTILGEDLFLVIRLEKPLQGKQRNDNSTLPATNVEKTYLRYRTPYAWTAVHLADVFGSNHKSSSSMDSLDRNSSNQNTTNSLDSRFGLGEFEKFRKKWSGSGGQTDHLVTTTMVEHRGSLDRRTSSTSSYVSYNGSASKGVDAVTTGERSLKHHRKQRRYSWSEEDLLCSTDATQNTSDHSRRRRSSRHPSIINNTVIDFRPVTLTINGFFKQETDKLKDEDLYKLLHEFKCQTWSGSTVDQGSSSTSGVSCSSGNSSLLSNATSSPGGIGILASKKLKNLNTTNHHGSSPTCIKLDISPFTITDSSLENLYTTDLLQIASKNRHSKKDVGSESSAFSIVRELLEFPSVSSTANGNASTINIATPHNVYRNLLYVYPKELNLSSRTGSARNITVKVQLMCGEHQPEDAMHAIFNGDGGSGENKFGTLFTNEAYTSVTYHQRWPSFYDEIKIKLPADIHGCKGDGMDKNGSKNYHLLFTFYHVSCSKGKDGDKDKKTGVGQLQSLETPVGYTWLPLLKDRALVEGEYNLPVALHPIDPILANYSYITADVALPGIEWLDNHKPHFVVYIKPVSSIHPGDTALNSFFSFCSLLEPLLKDYESGGDKLPRRLAESNIEAELKHRLTNITRTAIRPLVQYINVVLDKLFALLVEPPRCMNSVDTMNIGTSVFHTLQQLIFIITKEQNGNEVLQSYIRYHFGCAILTNEEYNGERLENYFDLEKTFVDSSNDSSPLTDKEISSSFSDSVFKAYGTTFTKTTGGNRSNFASNIKSSIQHDEWLVKRSKALNRLQALHQCIIEHWILCTDMRIAAATDSTFFFDVLIKCMALGVTLCYDENETNIIPGIARFTGQFLQDLRNLLINFYKYIAECIITSDKGNTYLERTKLLNNNIASFLRDLLLVFINDENGLNYVYALVGEYVITMTAKQKVVGNNKRSYSILSSLKLDFFKILSEHRYYVELNLLHNNLDSTVLTDICDEYRNNHYLSSLVIEEFVEVLRSPTNDSKVKEKATELIIGLLQKHDLKVDELKVTVAWLYVPLLSTFIKDQALLGILLSDQDDLDNDNLDSFDDDDKIPSRRSSRRTVSFEAISSSSISSVKAAMTSTSSLLSEKAIQNILVSILWILRNIREEVVENFHNEPLIQYLSALSTWHANNLLSLMHLCVERFRFKAYSDNKVNENSKKKNNSSKLCKSLSLHCPATSSSVSSYASLPPVVNQNNQSLSSINSVSSVPSQSVDDVKSRLEDVILGRQGARNDLMERRKSAANTNTKVRWNKDLMHYGSNTIASSSTSVNALRQLRYRSKSQKCSDVSSYELSTENLLANDVGYIVLDTLENIIQVSSRPKGGNTQFMVTTVPSTVRLAFKVLLRALKTYQYQSYPNNCTKDAPSIGALKKTFEIIRSTITQYPRLLFTNNDQGNEEDGDSGCDCESIDQTDCNKLLQKTCLAVLCHFYLQGEKCNCNEDSILMQASATFYWLMRVNYNLDNNFPRVKMYGALALSTLLEKKDSEDLWYCNFIDNQRYRGIKLALQAVMKYADNMDSSSFNGASTMLSTKFADQVRGTVDGMLKVIESINKIHRLMKSKTSVGDSSLVMNPSLLISSEDSQLLLEFMYSVACGYQQASACLMPQLRLRWLQRMASIHVKNGNYCEAAMCHINGTALLCEYLKRSDNGHYNLSVCKGATCLESISPNVLIEESAVSEELFQDSNDLYEMCEETLLEKSLEGGSSSCCSLLDLITIELQKAADLLWKASLYEKMAKVYNNLLIPLIERGYGGDVKEDISRYGRLAEAYGKLREAYIMLDKKQKKSKPNSETFYDGTYFRVGIYYNGIGDIETSSGESEDENNDLEFSGKQYIYKEPQLTKLSEIFDRLQSHYSDKYGAENVIAVKHSNRISGESIDHKKKVYIQITYVEPCIEPSLKLALHSNQSSITNDDSDNIKRFVYSTPFTLDDDGRTHACQLRDQYKRKTLLTTERHFPYILTRIPVLEGNANITNNRGTNTTPSRRPVEQNYGDHMEVIVMQPIEVAIEDLQRKTQELARSINQTPADAKMLQMVLQGCIGTTVNCGPMEMATVFLSQQQNTNGHNNLLMSRLQNKLRLCFKDFSRKCADALEKNRGLIGPDQRRYQQELERNYTRFSEQLAPLLLNSNKNGIE